MAFATEADLENLTGQPIETAQAALLLDGATAAIQEWTGQTIEAVEADEVTLVGNFTRKLVLPEMPVTAVDSVVVDGDTLTVSTDFTWQRHGVLWRPRYANPNAPSQRSFEVLGGAYWGGPDREVVVTYDHGFATIPPMVKTVCLAIAVRAMGNPGGVRAEAIDGYSITYDRNGTSFQILDGEMKLLRKYRRSSL